ncbi:MAG: YbhB/YbcL family Raf kinase inhibitor-like protein, partial [Candidatus Nanohaloarchaea archaeon]
KIWVHWTVWNIPPGANIGEGSIPEKAEEGMTDFRDTGYGGPNPPDGTHTYRFRAYALDTELDLSPGATKEDVLDAIDGHIVEEAKLEGDFSPL